MLVYYAIANASAWTLPPGEGRPPRVVPVLGLVGCVALAFSLPPSAVLSGTAVLAVGAVLYGARHLLGRR